MLVFTQEEGIHQLKAQMWTWQTHQIKYNNKKIPFLNRNLNNIPSSGFNTLIAYSGQYLFIFNI